MPTKTRDQPSTASPQRTTRSMTIQSRGDRHPSATLTLSQTIPGASAAPSPAPADGFFDGVNGYAQTSATKAQKAYLQSLQRTVPLPAPPLTRCASHPSQPPFQSHVGQHTSATSSATPSPFSMMDFASSPKDVGLAYLSLALPMAQEALGAGSSQEVWEALFSKELVENASRS